MAVMAGMLSYALVSTRYLGNDNFSYDYPAWCLLHRKFLETIIIIKETSGLHITTQTISRSF